MKYLSFILLNLNLILPAVIAAAIAIKLLLVLKIKTARTRAYEFVSYNYQEILSGSLLTKVNNQITKNSLPFFVVLLFVAKVCVRHYMSRFMHLH